MSGLWNPYYQVSGWGYAQLYSQPGQYDSYYTSYDEGWWNYPVSDYEQPPPHTLIPLEAPNADEFKMMLDKMMEQMVSSLREEPKASNGEPLPEWGTSIGANSWSHIPEDEVEIEIPIPPCYAQELLQTLDADTLPSPTVQTPTHDMLQQPRDSLSMSQRQDESNSSSELQT